MASPLVVDQFISRLAELHDGVIPHGMVLQHHEPAVLNRRIKHGLLVPLCRGASLMSGTELTPVRQAIAAALISPRAVISHRAAASVWDALPGNTGVLPEVSTFGEHRPRLSGVIGHRTTVPFELTDTSWRHGVRVTSPSRNLVELAAVLRPDPLELVLDTYLHRNVVTIERVRRVLNRWESTRGLNTLERLLDDRSNGSGIVRSWLELKAVQCVLAAGLPKPIRNFRLVVKGAKERVLDLAWPELLVGVEADSWQFHSSPSDWGKTRIRDRELQVGGWTILPCVVADTRDPEAFISALAAILSRMSGQLDGGQTTGSARSG